MVRDTFSPAFVIVSAKDIAQRAYEIYVDRGYADGFDRQDWLRAEHELKNPPLAERDDDDERVERRGSAPVADRHLLV